MSRERKDMIGMPTSATRVFEGDLFDVYQWEQELYDGSKVTFEKLARDDATYVIPVTDDGHIILLEQEQPGDAPFLAFAGGRLDRGENPEEGAKRELLEETGYAPQELTHWYTVTPFSKIDWRVHTYVARGCKKVAEQHLDAGEKVTLRFITFDEFIEIAAQGKLEARVLAPEALEAKLDPKKMDELKKLFFG